MIASAAFPALGTTAVVAAADPAGLEPACRVVEQEIAAIDLACSRFRGDSELVRLNRRAGNEVQVGSTLFAALRVALWAARATEGLVDPTIGRALRLTGYDRTFDLVVAGDGSRLRARFEPVAGWTVVELDVARSTVRVPGGVELDLGATAKALAADRSAAAAHAAAGCGVLVSLGGDIAVAGVPPDDGWPVRIADDHAATLDAPGPTVTVVGGGLASSGTTVRRWRAREGALHHILDPRSGRPADTPWRTVTVAAGSCVDANVAATAAVVLGEAAPEWLETRRLPARLARRRGRPVTVAGWPTEAA